MALYYSRWENERWTAPIDVLVSPDGEDIWPFQLSITDDDYIHVFWGNAGQLFHSVAYVAEIGNPHLWSTPNRILTDFEPFRSVSVARDQAGMWYLVYGNRSLDTISMLVSKDNAMSWSKERIVYQEPRIDTWVSSPAILVAPDGSLWVKWEEGEAGLGQTKGIAFTRSSDDGQTWNEAEQFVEGYYFGGFRVIDDTMVKAYGGGVGTGGRYISFSYDSGKTWSEERNISFSGGEGAQGIGLVRDSAGTWHFLIEGGSTFAQVAWDGQNWYPPDLVLTHEAMSACCITPGRVTENAVAGISDGNRMHVIFEQDNRILWHSSRLLDAPAVVPAPLAPKTPSISDHTIEVSPTIEAVVQRVVQTRRNEIGLINLAPERADSPAWQPILIVVVLDFLTISVAFILHKRFRPR